MKHSKKLIAAFCLLLPLTQASFAEDAPATPAAPANPHHGMGHMGMTEEQKTEFLKNSQKQILEMHDLSTQILAEKDPAKKELLKQKQLELMKSNHEEMRAMHEKMIKAAAPASMNLAPPATSPK